MSENPRRGRQARNFTTNVPKILDLKSSSEQIFFRKLSLGAPVCMENHANVTGWQKLSFLKQMLLTFGGRYNRYFWDIRLKILKLPNFNMLFQLVLTKFFKSELFSCVPTVGYVIKSCKEPIALSIANPETGLEMNTDVYICEIWTYSKQKIMIG